MASEVFSAREGGVNPINALSPNERRMRENGLLREVMSRRTMTYGSDDENEPIGELAENAVLRRADEIRDRYANFNIPNAQRIRNNKRITNAQRRMIYRIQNG